jgi:SAM-dependent methyltransferase
VHVVRRTIRLFRLFLAEQSGPEMFYTALAADSVSQVAEFTLLADRVVVDVGGGPGHFTREFQSRGASCVLVEPDTAELRARGDPPPGAVRGDGMHLPLADSTADICFSSNVLEHVREPLAMLDEMIRVTRPGGVVYLAFTNWYSPWGGHEMSPWHYLGARYAEQRYARRTGRKSKHQVGTSLFPVHVGPMLRAVRSRPDVSVLAALPRYYPRWCRSLVRIPGVREVATWNLLLVLRRNPDPGLARQPAAAAGRMAAS